MVIFVSEKLIAFRSLLHTAAVVNVAVFIFAFVFLPEHYVRLQQHQLDANRYSMFLHVFGVLIYVLVITLGPRSSSLDPFGLIAFFPGLTFLYEDQHSPPFAGRWIFMQFMMIYGFFWVAIATESQQGALVAFAFQKSWALGSLCVVAVALLGILIFVITVTITPFHYVICLLVFIAAAWCIYVNPPTDSTEYSATSDIPVVCLFLRWPQIHSSLAAW